MWSVYIANYLSVVNRTSVAYLRFLECVYGEYSMFNSYVNTVKSRTVIIFYFVCLLQFYKRILRVDSTTLYKDGNISKDLKLSRLSLSLDHLKC